jgi:hypothetical protein
MALDAFPPGLSPEDQIEPLACGRDAADVWDHAADGVPDEHERSCPHCAAAIADARGLDGIVHRMADEVPPPPPSLRPQDLLALYSPAGPARLSRPAAARVLRHVVDRMDGMRARSCRIEQDGLALSVAITVTARFGVDLASVTARVRQMVVAAGKQALGTPVARVDITVVDLWEER